MCAVSAYLHQSPHNHAKYRIFFPTQTDYKTQIKYTLAVRLWLFYEALNERDQLTAQCAYIHCPILFRFFFPSVVFSLVCCWIKNFLIGSTERERKKRRMREKEKKKRKMRKIMNAPDIHNSQWFFFSFPLFSAIR